MTENIIDTFINIENAAHTGAFGENPRATPTDAQCIAGNYKLGKTRIYDIPVAIEQPRNSYRTGVDKNGKRWTNRMGAHYGYFSGTKGADGDGVDCFIGFYPQSEHIYIINQFVGGRFDEHKVCLCFPDEQTAKDAYLNSYDKGWTGLQSMVKASISQFKWWLKNGNMKNPLAPTHLPYEGLETMNQHIAWDSAANPKEMTLDKLLYEIKRADSGENLIFDAVCMRDILEDAESIMTFDALVTPYAKLERKMQVLQNVMDRHGGTIKVEALQISDPFKQGGVAQVAVIFELSDGQTVSIFFHNPDVDPRKVQQSDELISWKWLLNKKDITIVVAPERGQDLNIKAVAERIMRLAEKNSTAFIRANTKRAEKMQAIEDIKTEIVSLEQEPKDVQHELEVAKVEAEDRLLNPVAMADEPSPTSPEGYAKINGIANLELRHQDALDDFFQERIIAVRSALMDIGWVGVREKGNYDLSKNGYVAKFNFKRVGAGANVVGYWVSIMDGSDVQAEIGDKLTDTTADVAASVDAVVTNSGQVTQANYPDQESDTNPDPIITTEEENTNEQENQQTEVTAETETGGAEVGVENPEPVAELLQGLAEKQAAREADSLLSDLKYTWNPLEYVNVMTSVGSATMQDWLVALYGSGYTHIETRKKGAATTYWMVNKEHKAQGFTKNKVFNAFLKAALAFGEGDTLLSMKKALKALGIDVSEQELTPSESVDAAYQFNATDDLKEWLAESIDKTEYSPFLTAKAMDEAAKRNGADIEWGFFGGAALDSVSDNDEPDVDLIDEDELGATFEPDSDDETVFDSVALDGVDQDGYVGKINKDGAVVGRIDMGDDGKALVFVGESGDVRVKTKSGIDFTYSDDDAAEMVDSLFSVAQEIQSGEVENESETENAPVPVPGDSDEVITPSVEEPGEVDNPTEEQINETKTVEDLAPAVTGNTELDKQRAKLKSLAALQERMKTANKIIKSKTLTDDQKKDQLTAAGEDYYRLMKPDFAGRIGYADYLLTNNNAVIRSTQKRIEQLEAKDLAESLAASGERETSYDFDGGTIDLDYGDDRLRVNFDSKPAPDMISKLKQNGFKWSPTNTAWQRQLTDNAISTANYLFGTTIQTAASAMNEEVNKPRGDVIVPAATGTLTNPIKAGFEAELEALKSETDIEKFDRRLDDIADRIEQAGLLEALDKELNGTADQLTALMAEAEKNAA